MFEQGSAVLMMVGKVIDAERLASAKRERILSGERQTRRFPRRTR